MFSFSLSSKVWCYLFSRVRFRVQGLVLRLLGSQLNYHEGLNTENKLTWTRVTSEGSATQRLQ